MTEVTRVTIDRLGHRGDGIARGPFGPIFVQAMLPGEEVEGVLKGDVLEDARIVTPSALRVKPLCKHAKTCGGCQLQHANEAFVAQWKRDVVIEALAGQGLETDVRPETVTSPPRSRRRATLSGRRTKTGVQLGFHAKGRDLIVAIPECQLLHPDVMATFPALEALIIAGGSRTNELSLTVTQSLSGPDVAVTGGKPLDANLHMDLAALAEKFGIARLTWDGETVAMREPPLIRLGEARVGFPPAAFLQATREGEAALLQEAMSIIKGAKRVVDLFCGMGTFALPIAKEAEVHAVEGAKELTAALDHGARMTQGLKRLTSETRDLFRRPLEHDEFKGFDAIVIDPPRAGAEAQCERLASLPGPRKMAMVSCNPISFARDAKALTQGGWTLDHVTVVDQFRWSVHIELVASFTKL